MNKHKELEGSIQKLLSILKKNRENVDPTLLKTVYRDAYQNLLKQVKQAATDYLKFITLSGLPINPDIPFTEQCSTIQKAVDQSDVLIRYSHSLFHDYDLQLAYNLALELRAQIKASLAPYIALQDCWIYDWLESDKEPFYYNTLTNCIYDNGKWVPLQVDMRGKFLYYPNSKYPAGYTPAESQKECK